MPNPIWRIGSLPIVLFPVLLTIGCLVGARQALRIGARTGLDRGQLLRLIAAVLLAGFAGAHLFDVVAYTPQRIERNPLIVLEFWRGLSSYGGFAGALAGFLWYTRRAGLARLAHADAIGYGLAPGWIFGRLGCFTAHDHPGELTDFFLAVDYPGGRRHDLGLYEAILAVALTVLVLVAARRKRPAGTIIGLLALLYAPVRFGLDFLRATGLGHSDPRYAGLTPAQWLSIATFALGLAILSGRRSAPAG
ncbi:MAG: prolipoprotein diacylglyceryl transferase [Deltaproteobacteria bacterium]|nr:prolipoprotein diacylglyceryl transferase [Deltaproteobacteria bacterium]